MLFRLGNLQGWCSPDWEISRADGCPMSAGCSARIWLSPGPSLGVTGTAAAPGSLGTTPSSGVFATVVIHCFGLHFALKWFLLPPVGTSWDQPRALDAFDVSCAHSHHPQVRWPGWKMCQLRKELCLPLLLLIPLRITTKSDPNPQMCEESPLCACVSHWHQHRAGRDPQAQENGESTGTRPSAPNSGFVSAWGTCAPTEKPIQKRCWT